MNSLKKHAILFTFIFISIIAIVYLLVFWNGDKNNQNIVREETNESRTATAEPQRKEASQVISIFPELPPHKDFIEEYKPGSSVILTGEIIRIDQKTIKTLVLNTPLSMYSITINDRTQFTQSKNEKDKGPGYFSDLQDGMKIYILTSSDFSQEKISADSIEYVSR